MYINGNISAVVDNKIAEFMKEVDLGYLLDRIGGLDTAECWLELVSTCVSLEIPSSTGLLYEFDIFDAKLN